MTNPTYFTVIGDYKAIVADTTNDTDANPDLGVLTATVTFTPMINNGDVLLATQASPRPTGFVPAPITGFIDTDGRLKLRAAANGSYDYTPVRLLANSPLLNLSSPLTYRVSFSNVTYNNATGTITSFFIEAPSSDTVVDLITAGRVPGQTAVGITHLAPDAVRIEGTDLIFSFGSNDIPDPVSLEGLRGPTGATGSAATVSVGSTTTGAAGSTVSVTNSGSSGAAVLDFTIPRGDTGATGPTGATGSPGAAATISIGSVTSSDPGGTASVTNVGSSTAAVFDIQLPRGATGSQGIQGIQGEPGVSVDIQGTVATYGDLPTNAVNGDAWIVAADGKLYFHDGTGFPSDGNGVPFRGPQGVQGIQGIQGVRGDTGATGSVGPTGPAGPTGNAATITIGSVTTGAAGSTASVVNSGTSGAAVFDITIPRGDTGSASAETWDTLIGKPTYIAAGSTKANARTAIDAEYTGAKGAANGYASLDASGLVPQSQLPITTASWSTLDGKPTVVAAGATKADARTAIDAEYTGNKGASGGYAALDSGGKVPIAQIPAGLVIDSVAVVGDAFQFYAQGSTVGSPISLLVAQLDGGSPTSTSAGYIDGGTV